MGFAAMLADEYILIIFSLSAVAPADVMLSAFVLIFIIIYFIVLHFSAGRYKFQHSSKPCTLCAI